MTDVTLKVKIPLKLANELEQILQTKGLTLDEAARIYFRSCVSKSVRRRALGLGDTFPFGKYQDEYVEVVAKAEPDYILWLIENNIKVNFQPEVLKLVEDVMSKERDGLPLTPYIDWNKRPLIDNTGEAVCVYDIGIYFIDEWKGYCQVQRINDGAIHYVNLKTGKSKDGNYWVEND